MTTFTTEDRMAAAGVFPPEEQFAILSKLVNEQYNQVKSVLHKAKEKPLTDDEIKKIYLDMFGFMLEPSDNRLKFARAIEKAHHIGE